MLLTWILTCVLGLAILLSYYATLGGEPYLESTYWLGLPRTIVRGTTVTQVLAAAGFLAFLVAYSYEPPTKGILATSYGLPVAVSIFLLGSLAWPW